jgi:putative ABC transport system ATP-binding protein
MIQTHQLAFRYPGGSGIRFPDVDLPQGGTLLLRGKSGSGKSTWLALCAGLLRPASGSLLVAAQDLNAIDSVAVDAWRSRAIGFLPQKLHLSPALDVRRNLALAYFAAGRPVDDAAIGAALASLGVADLAQRRPATLSGGQAQRVALARAVLLAPRVLLADEPTASLDDDAAAEAVKLLHTTALAHGASLVIATHDARVAPQLPAAQTLDLDANLSVVGQNGRLPTPVLRG